MAHIQRRETKGGDTFRVMFRINSKLVSETFAEPADAAEFAALVDRIGGAAAREVLKQVRGSDTKLGDVPTVAEALTDHIDNLSGITEGTRRDYRKIAQRFADSRLGPLPVDALTKDAVRKWVNAQTHWTAKTIRNHHGLLFAAMARQVEKGVIATNPCQGVKIGRSEQQEMCILTPAELGAILEHLGKHWHPLIITLAGTGLRLGEATALQVRDVDLDAGSPHLRVARAWKHTDTAEREVGAPKTRRGRRIVPLDPHVVDALRSLATDRPRDAWVFTNTRGAPIRQNSLHEIWSNALDDADIGKRPRIHDLRHTHASWLINDNVPLTEIQHLLGHESIKTTSDTYGHLMPDAHRRATASIKSALSKALSNSHTG